MGRVEVSTVVVLGDAAVFLPHVRFDDLGTVPLCCGHFWRNDDGDAGVRDGRSDHEVEGRGGDAAAECERTNVAQLIENGAGVQGRGLLEVAGKFEE